MKKLLILLSVVIYFSSCEDLPAVDSESYILEYIVGEIAVVQNKKEGSSRGEFATVVIRYDWDKDYKFVSKDSADPNDRALFEELCIKHGDTSYNREISPIGRECFASDFVSINVVSDVDYDELHSAGSSLNNICMLTSTSVYKYIQSGYKVMYDWENDTAVESEYSGTGISLEFPVIKMLDEIEPVDMVLLGERMGIARVLFMEAPTTNKTHTITVTMVDDTGTEFVASTVVTF